MHEDTRITTVRLSNKTYLWWKANGGNLSHFVRTKIEEEMLASHPLQHHTRFIDTAGVCYPHTDGGYCGICWKGGVPSREEWADYRYARNHESFVGSWHDYQDVKVRSKQSKLAEFGPNSDTPSKEALPRGGLLRRLWAWLV
jgi:hypothetical protein